jgi:hypothetical protein
MGPNLNSQSEFAISLCMGSDLNSQSEFAISLCMGSDWNPQSGSAFRLSKRIYDRFVHKGLEGRGATTGGHAVTARSGGTEPPQSPVFCGWPQKMRPNAGLKKSLISVNSLEAEVLYEERIRTPEQETVGRTKWNGNNCGHLKQFSYYAIIRWM